jgi:hypothetical protein
VLPTTPDTDFRSAFLRQLDQPLGFAGTDM